MKLLSIIQVHVLTTVGQSHPEVNLKVTGMSPLALFVINNSWCQTLKPFADVNGCKIFGVASGAVMPFHFTVLKCYLSAEDAH